MKGTIILVVLSVVPLLALNKKDFEDIPELQYMNLSMDPCEDFFEYTCGNFKNVYPLSDGESTIDHFTLLEEELTKLASLIFSEPDDEDDPQALNKTKSAYKACIDLEYLNSVKDPELTIVNEENGFPLVQTKCYQHQTEYNFLDIADAVSKYGIPMLFNVQAYGDLSNASNNVIYISPLDTTALTPSQIRPHHASSYEELIEEAFSKMGQENHKGSNILKPFDIFLRKMALKVRSAVQSTVTDEEVFKNIEAMTIFTRGVFTGGYVDNVTIVTIPGEDPYSSSLKEMNDWTKEQFNGTLNLDWVEFLQRIFANAAIEITEDTRVLRLSGLETTLYGLLNLVKMNEDHVVKSYVLMRLFTHLAPESDAESRQYLEDYFTSLNVPILPRWKYCTRKLIDSVGTASMSFAAAYEYQLRHFNVNHLKEAVELIEDLQEAFKEILQNTTWMDDSSKSNAMKKLENMITILGHPDVSYDKDGLDKFYENLRICKWDNYGNSLRIKAFKNAYQISQVAKRERAFWEKSPFEVNAYYNRPNNKMIFPIAMLHPVFFGNNNSILDYGRIGTVIGHELTHGFDKSGMSYDEDGLINPWWSAETIAEFTNRTECFVEEYNEFYQAEIDAYVDGQTTLNENIADNGGVREAFRALKTMLKRKKHLTGTDDFTPEQLFFIGFGTMWCSNPSLEYLRSMQTNAHCMSKFRVNGVVSNMEEFSQAFNCSVGSNMNPANKCLLW